MSKKTPPPKNDGFGDLEDDFFSSGPSGWEDPFVEDARKAELARKAQEEQRGAAESPPSADARAAEEALVEAEARAGLTAATARRSAATAERELAATEATRAITLARDRLIATTSVDTAKTRLRAAQAAEDAAVAEARRARSALLSAGVGDLEKLLLVL